MKAKVANTKAQNDRQLGTSTIPISSNPQVKPLVSAMEPLVQTEYPSGTSGITLQNNFVQSNVQIGTFTDDSPVNLSMKHIKTEETNRIKINPDLKKYREICQTWKNYEKDFKRTYPVIDKNFLWSKFWNEVFTLLLKSILRWTAADDRITRLLYIKLDRKQQEIYKCYRIQFQK